MTEGAQEPQTVMPALEAGIHANATGPVFAWMAGSSPAVTEGAMPSQGVGGVRVDGRLKAGHDGEVCDFTYVFLPTSHPSVMPGLDPSIHPNTPDPRMTCR